MRTGSIAIGLAALVGAVSASSAQDSRVPVQGKPAGTGIKAARQSHQGFGGNTGITLDVPVGRVWVSPDSVAGEPIYVRRTTAGAGLTIVEVSTTPFIPVLASNEQPTGAGSTVRSDQPASW